MKTKITALFILLILSLTAFAEIFVVTSNADSGPGTLREAIEKANANGTADADVINFNIADVTETGRTITLLTELPAISSNVTIDASTQPGALLGISFARVTLYLGHYTSSPFTFLYIRNASYVKLYGLCFKYFGNPNAGGGEHYAIGLRNSSNITIGSPGKGNMFCNVRGSITNRFWNYSYDAVNDVTIQSNVFGLNSLNILVSGGYIQLDNAANVTFGGPNSNEGNVLIEGSITILESPNPQYAFFVKMQNNRFNLDWTGSKYYYHDDVFVALHGATGEANTVRTFIQDNVLISSHSLDGIVLFNIPHKVIITGNRLGIDITGTHCYGAAKLQFISCKNVVVGGYTEAEQNIFGGPLYSQTKGVHIIQNTLSSIGITGATMADPYVRITSYDNGLITGISQPNSKIQLYAVTCYGSCLPYKYYATVSADAEGKWSFPYTPGMPNLAATATTPDSSTSEFSKPIVDHYTNQVIKHATCGKSNGSITGIKVTAGTHIAWLDSYTLKVVSTDTNLVNVPAGSYVLTVSNGANGCKWSANFTIADVSLPPSLHVYVQDATCGKTNGTLFTDFSGRYGYKWLNANHDSIGNNYFINNLPAGTYYVKAYVLSDTSCNKIYGPYTINNLSGPTLSMAPQIKAATCSQANGSITGITATNVTGTPFIQWIDSLNRPVGNNYDLLNLSPGKYRLKFKDQGNCDTIITPFYTIEDLGKINIDSSAIIVSASNCWQASGTIKGIDINGATNYQWNNSDGEIISLQIDPGFVLPGRYVLKVNNSYGCESSTKPITVPIQGGLSNIFLPAPESSPGLCDIPNGYIRFNNYSNTPNYTFRWVDSTSSATVGNNLNLENIVGGTFYLYAQNLKGCEQMVFSANLKATTSPHLQEGNVGLTDDICDQQKGAITNISMEPGTGFPSFSYTWYDEQNNIAGTSKDLTDVKGGKYFLIVRDSKDCKDTSRMYTIANRWQNYSKPLYPEFIVPKGTAATLNIQNPQPGTYQLFGSSFAALPIEENTSGNFSTGNLFADTILYVKVKTGLCESEQTAIPIKVVDDTKVFVPTGFSPNGDGKNDVIRPKVFGMLQLEFFTIYNRWGEVVFTTKDLMQGWNGYYKQLPAPGGVYVWMLKGKDISGNIIQLKGSFILLK